MKYITAFHSLEATEQVEQSVSEMFGEIVSNFNPMGFVESLKYMGAGLLGIFIVMGIIIAATYGLGRLFSRRQKKQEEL